MSWTTPYSVVLEDDAIRVLKFKDDVEGVSPILFVPPQAGHRSDIVDYDHNQSLVATAVEHGNGGVYTIDFKNCTFARKREGIEDLVDQVKRAVNVQELKVHIVGLCQGGWLSYVFACLNPGDIKSLTIAGAPMDSHAGDSIIAKANKVPFMVYQSMVALGAGLVHGQVMLFNWKLPNWAKHKKAEKDPTPRNIKFYDWYNEPRDIAGGWYLWCIENIFISNNLFNGKVEIDGKKVVPGDVRYPVHLVAGERDDISPPEQTFNLASKFAFKVKKYLIKNAGHIGVFMGPESMKTYAGIFKRFW